MIAVDRMSSIHVRVYKQDSNSKNFPKQFARLAYVGRRRNDKHWSLTLKDDCSVNDLRQLINQFSLPVYNYIEISKIRIPITISNEIIESKFKVNSINFKEEPVHVDSITWNMVTVEMINEGLVLSNENGVLNDAIIVEQLIKTANKRFGGRMVANSTGNINHNHINFVCFEQVESWNK